MKRLLFPLILIFSMLFSSSGRTNSVYAVNLPPLPDQDMDSIPNALEANGWYYDTAGGPYMTNPKLADSDHDGLTDGEEKLFNTNPNDPTDPGIAVPYENSFKTLKYFSANVKDSVNYPLYLHMKQGGSRYLLTEAAVIRRGTTFKITADSSAGATLTITGPNMTAITPVREPARGGWLVKIPADGTVGTYTATISKGDWWKAIPIYVIFELPTNLTQAQTNAYLYDDNPASRRDQVAVWWRAVDWQYFNDDNPDFDPTYCTDARLGVCSNWAYHTMTGFAQAFWTEQYTKNVLVNYTIPVIQGKTDALDATTAIGTLADQSVWVNFNGMKNSFSSATVSFWGEDPANPGTVGWHMAGGACETQAGVYTAMLRSVGIASRPFAMDYNKTKADVGFAHGEDGNFGKFEYDHAVMMWVDGQWYAQRTFNGSELVEYAPTKSWTNGKPLDPPSLLADFRSKWKFQDTYADLIQSANEGWDFQIGSNGGGMVNEAWDPKVSNVPDAEFTNRVANRDFKWDSKTPLKIQQSPYVDVLNCQLWKGDAWAPSEWRTPIDSNPAGRSVIRTYNLPVGIPDPNNPLENWPYNPQPTSCTATTEGSPACTNFKAAWAATCAALPHQNLAAVQSTNSLASQPVNTALNTAIQLGSISVDAGQDFNGDGRIDLLNVQFSLTSAAAGKYQLGGWLKVGDHYVRAKSSQVDLVAGTQTRTVSFDGLAISDQQVNGPYQVDALWVAPVDKSLSELALPEEMLAYQTYTYSTQAYLAGAFTVRAAMITGNYSYSGTDANTRGLFGSIVVSVPLSIANPSTFTLEGDLYDAQGGFVDHATWTGSDPAATLKFAVKGTVPPYSLQHLNLSDAKGNLLAAAYASVYNITDLNGKVDPGNVTLGNPSSGTSTQAITPSNVFTLAAVDTNANGRFDQLVVSTTVNVSVKSDTYRMEGLLVDEQNLPVAWSVGSPKVLNVGDNQTLQMTFDGQQLFDNLPLAIGEKFTLIAVKIFSQSLGNLIPEVDLPITSFSTPSYLRSNLEPSYPASTVFQDDLEGTMAKWSTSGSTQWSQTNTFWRSFSHAWIANGSGSKNGLLTFAKPLDLRDYASPWLGFNTSYQMADGKNTTVEVSTDGTTWTVLKTFSGSTDYWSAEVVDLSAYTKKDGVRIRFNAKSNAGMVWAIDDVFVNAGPAVKSASFSHSPTIQVGKETTFTADYVSLDKTLPVTYLWDFCGSSKQVSTPVTTFMFMWPGNCAVKLTVNNSYDSADTAPQSLVVTPGFLHYFLPNIKR